MYTLDSGYGGPDCTGMMTKWAAPSETSCAAFHKGGMKILSGAAAYSRAYSRTDCTSGVCITSTTIALTNAGDTFAPTPTTSAPTNVPTNAGEPKYVHTSEWTGSDGDVCSGAATTSAKVKLNQCSQTTVNGHIYKFKVIMSGTFYIYSSWSIPDKGTSLGNYCSGAPYSTMNDTANICLDFRPTAEFSSTNFGFKFLSEVADLHIRDHAGSTSECTSPIKGWVCTSINSVTTRTPNRSSGDDNTVLIAVCVFLLVFFCSLPPHSAFIGSLGGQNHHPLFSCKSFLLKRLIN